MTQNQKTAFMDAGERERRFAKLLEEAKTAKSGISDYWRKMRAYYDGTHETAKQTGEFLSSMDLPWVPASVPDAYLHVESQIEAEAPDFEFSARGEKDTEKAALRERVVRYVVHGNDLTTKNAVNERRLHLCGSAVWKVAVGMGDFGDAEILIENPAPDTVFPDPAASTLDECEYVAVCYRMSTARAVRIFADDLARADMSIASVLHAKKGKKHIFDEVNEVCDTLEITEFWFRQPTDGEERVGGVSYTYQAGDIALSILIEGAEVRYVPKFWTKTSYRKYPFVIYQKIPTEGSIWGKSELEPIIPLIDAADRQLAFAQLNTAFFANDILLYEENAFASDSYPENRPGAIWKLRPGMADKVKRLGGLSAEWTMHYEIADKYRAMMKETLGNFDFLQGDSATQVSTATGLALLGDYAGKRTAAKNICKKAGFERLYRLIDAMAMEVYSEERLKAITDIDMLPDMMDYVPTLDVSIHIGDGISNSRSFTLKALEALCSMDLNAEHYPMVRAYIGALGIPERAELIARLDERFSEKGKREA